MGLGISFSLGNWLHALACPNASIQVWKLGTTSVLWTHVEHAFCTGMQHDMVLGYLIWLKPITIDGLTQNLGFSIHLYVHYQHALKASSCCSHLCGKCACWQIDIQVSLITGMDGECTQQLNHGALLSLGWAIPTTAWVLNCRGYISKSLLYFYYCLVWYVCL